jgi:hypothetical protein
LREQDLSRLSYKHRNKTDTYAVTRQTDVGYDRPCHKSNAGNRVVIGKNFRIRLFMPSHVDLICIGLHLASL